MKYLILFLSIFYSININSQINNIAERLGYDSDSKLLIIHGDDIGVSHSVNIASFDGYLNNVINSGSAMIPSPWIKEVAEFHKKHPKYDLGLHLTLTAEWKNYKWRGVSSSNEIKSLINNENEFFDNTGDVNINADPEEVRKELQAQIDFSRLIGINPTHIDTHMGALAVNKHLWRVYIEVGHKNKLVSMVTKSRSLNLFDEEFPMPKYIVPVNDIYMLYPGADRTFIENAAGVDIANSLIVNDIYKYEDWYKLYSNKIKSLQPGLNVFLLHLGYDNEELKAVTVDHPEYGSLWRQLDYDVFKSKEIKQLLKDEGIKLVTWGEIRNIIYD
tara:strand:- start:9408 stop:10397 length:990 start_codon:yes stop_codon:yes gene_type:complete